MRNNEGFTLIEVMVAAVVLGTGIMGLWIMQTRSTDSNSRSFFDTTALFEGADHVEEWMKSRYGHLELNDTNGNGTGQDPDGDGAAANNFGLNDFPGCDQVSTFLTGCTNQAADFTQTIGNTTIHWNVAIDYPVEYTKTIRVHLLRPMTGNNPITVQYTKEEGI